MLSFATWPNERLWVVEPEWLSEGEWLKDEEWLSLASLAAVMFGNGSEIRGTSIWPLVVRGESDMSPLRELSSFCWFSSFSFPLLAASRAIDSLTLTRVSYERDRNAASRAWILRVSFSNFSCSWRRSFFSLRNLFKYKSEKNSCYKESSEKNLRHKYRSHVHFTDRQLYSAQELV